MGQKYIFYDMVKKHVHQSIDETAGYSKHLVTVVAGERRYQKLKEIATHYVIDRLDESIEDAYEYSYDAMNLHEVLDDKMKKLTSEEFVEFLTKRAGKTLKKRKIYKSPPPLYD